MLFYINVALSEDGIAELQGNMEKVDTRMQASELVFNDAAHILRLARDRWPDLGWNVEQVSMTRYVVKGEPKSSTQ